MKLHAGSLTPYPDNSPIGLDFKCLVYIAYQIPHIAPTIQQRDHSVFSIFLCKTAVSIQGRVPLPPKRLQLRVKIRELALELRFCLFEVTPQLAVILAHFLAHAHLFKLHIEFEDLFEQISGYARILLLVTG